MFGDFVSDMDILLFIGAGIVVGFAVARMVGLLHLPSVVGYIVAGMFLGPSILGFYHSDMLFRMDSLSDLALSIVAFIIGSELRWKEMARVGKKVFVILIAESLGAFLFVFAGIWLFTHDAAMALIFASMAPATAPAGTVAVIQECRSRGILTNTLLAIVGLDDGLAIAIFAFAIAMAKMILGRRGGGSASIDLSGMILIPLFDIFGAIILGLILGALLAYFVRRIQKRDQVLVLTLGTLLVCTGLSNHLHFSLILANLTLGTYIANAYPRASHRSLQGIQGISPPIFVIFFALAGAHLKISLLKEIGIVGLLYFFLRILGKFLGSWGGCRVSGAPIVLRKYLGMALFSQAGVAVGLALIIQKEMRLPGIDQPQLGLLVINTIAATTLLFEILGPVATRIAIARAGEEGKAKK